MVCAGAWITVAKVNARPKKFLSFAAWIASWLIGSEPAPPVERFAGTCEAAGTFNDRTGLRKFGPDGLESDARSRRRACTN